MVRNWWLSGVLVLAFACGDKPDEDDSDDDDGDDTSAADDSGGDGADSGDGPDGLPADPRPLTITVSGSSPQTIVFDQVTCTHPLNSSNFRVFWRGSGHVFVLKAEVLGDYEGPGTYRSGDTNTRASLQEEAGGSLQYFVVDPSAGDSVEFTMEAHDVEAAEAWGSFTISGMTGADENGNPLPIQISPSTVPIWCPVVA